MTEASHRVVLGRRDRRCGGGACPVDAAKRFVKHAEVVLLLPDDRPRPHDAQPPYRLPRREAVRPHQPQRDERPRPPEPVMTMHGDGAGGGVDDAEEGCDDGIGSAAR